MKTIGAAINIFFSSNRALTDKLILPKIRENLIKGKPLNFFNKNIGNIPDLLKDIDIFVIYRAEADLETWFDI